MSRPASAREIRFERDRRAAATAADLTAIDVDPRVHPGFVLPRRLCEHGTYRLELGPRRFDAPRPRRLAGMTRPRARRIAGVAGLCSAAVEMSLLER
jgi:hypothetical protein